MSAAKPSPIMAALAAALQSGPAQRRKDDFYCSRLQSYLAHTSKKGWAPTSATESASAASKATMDPKAIRLISWNIDMLVPFGNERMTAALQYLENLVISTPPDIAVVIHLQEMTPSDLDLIIASPWVRRLFNITDKDESSWLSPYYGTITLIDRRLSVAKVFRVPVLSKFDRDGLFVDIALSKPSASVTDSPKFLRLCNTHLESLVANPPVRPHQLSALAGYLHSPEAASALLAGDLNAIEPFDRTLHSDNKLEDAYLALGGKEGSHDGYTWGYQVPAAMREKFGCSRMDKVLFHGDIRVHAFERIGAGVKVAEEKREEMKRAGEEEWVSDHYGVMGDFEISGDWVLQTNGEDAELTRPKLC